LKPEFHLQRPWSFKASTTPTPTTTVQALLGELISNVVAVTVILSVLKLIVVYLSFVSEEYKHKFLNDEILE